MIKNIKPDEVIKLIANPKVQFIDVREEWEYERVKIPNARLIPLSDFKNQFNTLNKEKPIIVICHHGGRSLNVCAFLVRNGFKEVYNVVGGIDYWAKKFDNTLDVY